MAIQGLLLEGVKHLALAAVTDKALDLIPGRKSKEGGEGNGGGGPLSFLAGLIPSGPLGALFSLGRGAGKEEV